MIELYHGSPHIVEKPIFGEGNARNDYGLGFYCTREIELAKEWSCPTRNDGFANKYSFDMKGLDILDLSAQKYNILNWLAVLLENRIFDITTPLARDAKNFIISRFIPEYKSKDVIIGYRADDSYFSFAKAFINNTIPLSFLSKAMKLGKLGIQTCIKSETAFSRLSFQEAIAVDGEEYFIRRSTRDRKVREDYLKLLETVDSKNAIYIMDIIRQDWRNDDERLQ
ncbi:MAG: DUF3990 domain-containing protein [Bacteroidales bacterium]|nr:DUF3990 domain-containing protein [Bacteroidales bacterium]